MRLLLHRRLRRAPATAAAALAGTALVLAGCGLFGSEPSQPCPNVLILKEAGQLVRFAKGPGRDITDVEFQARINDFRGTCEYVKKDGDRSVLMSLFIAIDVERGPAIRERRASFEYFAAVPRFHPAPEGKRLFAVTVPFEGSQTRAFFTDELELKIPLKEGEFGPSYDVYLGFQLTPTELRFNRSRKIL